MEDLSTTRERALTASGEVLAALLHHPAADVLQALLDNPALKEAQLCRLLERKDLPGEFLEEVARRKGLLKSYRVKRTIAFHPHAPRLVSMRLLRELYLMDLVQFALLPGVAAELKRLADDQLLARLPQIALGQKITLGRRGPGRVAGMLLAEGHPQVLAVVLDNAHLNEGHILKVLAREKLPEAVLLAVARHRKWSLSYNVRIALVRHSGSPLSVVLGFLPHLTLSDLRELVSPGLLSENLRNYLQAEIARRRHAPPGEKPEESRRGKRGNKSGVSGVT